jgi:ATP-binding cassette, subfamily B, bacterial HlyB/CyaB
MDVQERPATSADAGLEALVLIARFHGIAADAAQLRHNAAIEHGSFAEADLVRSARSIGLKAQGVGVIAKRLPSTPFPALVMDRNGRHFILAGCDGKTGLIMGPGAAAAKVASISEILERSSGRMLLFASRASLTGEFARFDFSWFIPAIVKYRKLLLETLGVSLLLQVFGLVPPLMFQVIFRGQVSHRR